ncbi:MAG: helix-turn-helix domain-containing protein [Thermoplasmatales archaeon]|nr:helix-turn-helix domain-containing protein [Thermoplasmatales archaeon]
MDIAEKIAGEITLSEKPGKTIRKWRETFHLSQGMLADCLKISPSVISDYESGRRASPNTASVKKIVEAMIKLDEGRGSNIIKQYSTKLSNAIFDIREFTSGIPAKNFVESIKGRVVASKDYLDRKIHGYTVMDSLKAIMSLSSSDYLKIYGWSTERALVFTGVKYGRSPMVAVRAHPLKPGMVVYQKPEKVDGLAVKLAEVEKIPLVVSPLSLNKMIEELRKL